MIFQFYFTSTIKLFILTEGSPKVIFLKNNIFDNFRTISKLVKRNSITFILKIKTILLRINFFCHETF
jgi:hypothetical protein